MTPERRDSFAFFLARLLAGDDDRPILQVCHLHVLRRRLSARGGLSSAHVGCTPTRWHLDASPRPPVALDTMEGSKCGIVTVPLICTGWDSAFLLNLTT